MDHQLIAMRYGRLLPPLPSPLFIFVGGDGGWCAAPRCRDPTYIGWARLYRASGAIKKPPSDAEVAARIPTNHWPCSAKAGRCHIILSK